MKTEYPENIEIDDIGYFADKVSRACTKTKNIEYIATRITELNEIWAEFNKQQEAK
jgi:hypothetical protein